MGISSPKFIKILICNLFAFLPDKQVIYPVSPADEHTLPPPPDGVGSICPVICPSAGFCLENMADPKPEHSASSHPSFDEDELFLDQIRDSFCFFFAATVTLMEVVKYLQSSRDTPRKNQSRSKA